MNEAGKERRRFTRQQLAYRAAKQALAERPGTDSRGYEEKERHLHLVNCAFTGCTRVLFVRVQRAFPTDTNGLGNILEEIWKRRIPGEDIRNPLYCEHHQPADEGLPTVERAEESERP